MAAPFRELLGEKMVVCMSTPALLEAPESTRLSRPTLRGIAVVLLAGGIAGFSVGGLGTRIAMRIAALAAGDQAQGRITEAGATVGRITAEGTVFLFLFAGLGATVIGTAFYLVTRPWLPRRRRVRAIAFGILELIAFGSTLVDASNADFTILGHPLLNVVLFGTLVVLHGFALVMLLEPSGRFVSGLSRARWGARLVDLGAVVALALTAIGLGAIGARPGGFGSARMDHAGDLRDRRHADRSSAGTPDHDPGAPARGGDRPHDHRCVGSLGAPGQRDDDRLIARLARYPAP